MHSFPATAPLGRSPTALPGVAGQDSHLKFELRDAMPGFAVLTCHGGLSWEDRELLAASVEQFLVGRQAPLGLVMDMSRVEFVNSAGLGALFQLVQRLRSRRGQLAFANVPPTILRLLKMVGMERLATWADDVPQALQRLAQTIASPPSGHDNWAHS